MTQRLVSVGSETFVHQASDFNFYLEVSPLGFELRITAFIVDSECSNLDQLSICQRFQLLLRTLLETNSLMALYRNAGCFGQLLCFHLLQAC